MRIGCCVAALDDVAALDAAGAEFYELPVARVIMAADGEGFASLRSRAETLPLRPRAYNIFLPAELRVVGPSVDRDALEHYARQALARVHALGGGIVVFGSGRSRSIPEGFSRDAALDQLDAALRLVAGLAVQAGATLALEPLRRAETNVLNTVGEAAAFIRGRGLDNVRLLADLYHMMEEDESFEALDGCAELLVHAHVADGGRQPPGFAPQPSPSRPQARGLDAYDLTGFLRRLRQLGYAGDCSIECRWTVFGGQVGPSLGYVRHAAQAAGWR